jgi:hypothetical protein
MVRVSQYKNSRTRRFSSFRLPRSGMSNYYNKQKEYESSYLMYRSMKADDANLARDKISVYVPKQDSFQTVKTRLEELQQIVDKGWSHADQTFDHHAFRAIHFNRHLYYPLIHLPHDQHLTSSPVGLNQGEWTFVRNLE